MLNARSVKCKMFGDGLENSEFDVEVCASQGFELTKSEF